MDIPKNTIANDNSHWSSIGSAVRETLRESRKRCAVDHFDRPVVEKTPV